MPQNPMRLPSSDMTSTNTANLRERLIDEVVIGEEIPAFGLPLTMQRLVMEAAVNRDFTPLHHDRDDSRATGAPDAYANTIFIQAILEAALRTWTGPRGWLEELEIKMQAFNLVESFVCARGRVADISYDDNGGTVTLDVWLDADDLQTVVGRASVRLPGAAARA